MNDATITLKITISSKSSLPSELHNALFTVGGGLAAQIYDHLRDRLPELIRNEDFETDWLMKIKTSGATNGTGTEVVAAG